MQKFFEQHRWTPKIHSWSNLSGVIIPGKIQADQDNSLSENLKTLNKSGAELSRNICHFSFNQLRFYGHIFGKTRISPDSTKIQTIINTSFSEVRSVSDVRSFIESLVDSSLDTQQSYNPRED